MMTTVSNSAEKTRAAKTSEGLLVAGVSSISFLLPLLFSPLGAQHYTLPKLLFLSGAVALLLFIVGLNVLRGERQIRLGGPIGALFFAFIAFTVLSFLFGWDRNTGWFGHYPRHDGLITYLVLAGWWLVITQIEWSRANLSTLYKAIIAGSVIVALLSLTQFSGLITFIEQPAGGRVSATLGSPIFLGSFLAVGFCLALALALARQSPVPRSLLFGGAALMLFAVILTASRSALLGLLVGAALIILYSRSSRLVSVKNGAVAVLIAAVLVGGSQVWALSADRENLTEALSAVRLDQAVAPRLIYARAGLRTIASYPVLGVGPSNFPWAAQLHQGSEAKRVEGVSWRFDDAHNLWLQIGASLGLPALFVFIAIIIGFGRAWAGHRREDDLLLGLGIGVIAILVFASFEPIGLTGSALLWLFIGIVSSRQPDERFILKGRKVAMTAVIVAVVASMCTTYFLARLTGADLRFGAALNIAQINGDARRAHFAEAARIAPWVDVYHGWLGNSFMQEAKAGGGRGALDEGLRWLETSVEVGPFDPQNWTRLGLAYQYAADAFGSDTGEDALTAANTSLELAPDLPTAHRAVGVVLSSQGRLDEALERVLAAVELDPTYDEGWLWTGYVYEKLGRTSKSLDAYDRAKVEPWRSQARSRAQLLRNTPSPGN